MTSNSVEPTKQANTVSRYLLVFFMPVMTAFIIIVKNLTVFNLKLKISTMNASEIISS